MFLNIDRAQKLMDQAGIETIVATTPHNVVYSAGYWSLGHWALPGTQVYAVLNRNALDKPTLIVGHSELDMIVEQNLDSLPVKTIGKFYYDEGDRSNYRDTETRLAKRALTPTGSHSDYIEALAEVISETGASSVAIDERGIFPGGMDEIKKKLPRLTITPGYGLIQKIRMVKTSTEIDSLRTSAQITERAMVKCLEQAHEGMTERDMVQILHSHMVSERALPLLSVVLFGQRSALSNGIPSNAKLKKDDIIRFDIGCTYNHYTSDIARTAVFGEPTDRVKDYYNAILIGEQRAFDAARPGVTAGELFDIAIDGVRSSGIPHYQRHHVGHGVGIEVYDPPMIAPGVDIKLEPGMIIDIETPYYELGFAGLQIEDPMLIKKDGCELLTIGDRQLLIIS